MRNIFCSVGQHSHAHEGSYPSKAPAPAQITLTTALEKCAKHARDIIDIDEITSEVEEVPRGEVGLKSKQAGKQRVGECTTKQSRKWRCSGIRITFPDGTNHHMCYPFGIHSERSVPWNYQSVDDVFYIQAKSCQKLSSTEGGACGNCQELTSSTLFSGIMARIRFGAHENIPLVYHGVGALITIARRKTDQIEQLRMSKLNDSQKLLVKAGALEDHKQWILAIASGRVDRVVLLVQAGLQQRVGIKALIQQYEHAAVKLYKPKSPCRKPCRRNR